MTAFAIPATWRDRQAPARRAPVRPARHVPRRLPNEFYPTPPEATRALLSVERFDGTIWEPACGDGRIARVLSEHGHAVVATDLHVYGHGLAGVDFLKATTARAKHIVTNPPYGWGLADRFVARALELTAETGGKVAMLLNMASLAHRQRTAWWRAHPPARLYAVDDIVCWPEDRYGPPPAHFTKHRYVWAVWTQGHKGPSTFWWLSGAEFRKPRPKILTRLFNQRRLP
jgi:hypothetical protein